jgi:predicted MFS family arabinose efflux permease
LTNQRSSILKKDFVFLFIVALLVWSSYNLIQTVIPIYLSIKMKSTLSEIGLILSISSLSATLIRPFMGYAIDKFDRRLIIWISLIAMALINFAYIYAKTPFDVGLIRFIQGIPFAAATTAFGAIAADLIPANRRGEGLSYFTLTSTLAIAIGPGVGIALIYSNWLGLPFLVSGIVGVFCLAIIIFINIPKIDIKSEAFSVSSVFTPKTGWLVLTGALVFLGVPGIMTYSALYSKSIGIENISLAYTIYGIGMVLTRLISAKAIDKNGPAKIGSISIIILIFGFVFIGSWQSIYGLLIGSTTLGIGIGMITPTLFTMAFDITDSNKRGSCTAMVYTSFDIGNCCESLLFGVLTDALHSFSATYLSLAIFELIALFFFISKASPFHKMHKAEISL